MLWGLSEAWWMQIWSGVLGATVAAGVSVLVALIVVRRTNAHQSVIAGRALAEQRKRDAESLSEQRSRDAAALELQRQAFKEEVDMQRAETDRLRMMDIRADVVADATHVMDSALLNKDAIEAAIPPLSRSITRWRIESDDEDLVDELMNWPRFIGVLAKKYRIQADSKAATAEEKERCFDQLNSAVSLLAVVGIHLPRQSHVPKKNVHRILVKMREDIEAGGTGHYDD